MTGDRRRSVPVGLTPRVVASHILLVVIALLVFTGVILGFADRRLDRTAQQVDRAGAIRLAPLLGEAYERSGSWAGLERLLPGGGGMMGHRSMPMMRRMPPELETERFVNRELLIRDPGGNIVFTTVPAREPAPFRPDRGVAIEAGGRTVGYLYLGSMVSGGSSPLRNAILGALVRAASVTGLVVLLAAAAAAVFWSRWLLTPLRQLEHAARRLAQGDRSVRVAVPSGEHELATLARSFNGAVGEIERQEQARRRFVADAAHELRTPVNLLATRLEMIREEIYPPDMSQIAALDAGVRRLGTLVSDLQMLARIDAGRLQLERADTDIPALLEELRAMFLPEADRQQTDITIASSGPSLHAAIDRARMLQVLANFVSNALRYAGSEGPVELAATCSGSTLYLSVTDHGPGIPLEERERVFERFVRLDASRDRATGGTGLGLAIARDLVELHGGSVGIEGPPGTRVVVELPGACGE